VLVSSTLAQLIECILLFTCQVGFQQLNLMVGFIDQQLAAQSYHMWEVGEMALDMQRRQSLDAENHEEVVAGLAVISTRVRVMREPEMRRLGEAPG
jgi:hypothetical protein